MQRKFKNTSLPETDFLKGKVMILYREARSRELDTCSPFRQWSEGEQSTISKSSNHSQTTIRGVVEEKASRRGHQQEESLQDISDMPLWLLKCSLNIHLEVLLIRQTRACVLCTAALVGARLKRSDRKCRLRLYFLLRVEKTLLSYYKKWCKMIR